jgi:hypothetical protein
MWLTRVSTKRAVSAKPDVSNCVPHIEKMLYDNAQLARVYLHAWQLTGNHFFRTISLETLDYVAREMRSPEGAFLHRTLPSTAEPRRRSASPGREGRSSASQGNGPATCQTVTSASMSS